MVGQFKKGESKPYSHLSGVMQSNWWQISPGPATPWNLTLFSWNTLHSLSAWSPVTFPLQSLHSGHPQRVHLEFPSGQSMDTLQVKQAVVVSVLGPTAKGNSLKTTSPAFKSLLATPNRPSSAFSLIKNNSSAIFLLIRLIDAHSRMVLVELIDANASINNTTWEGEWRSGQPICPCF